MSFLSSLWKNSGIIILWLILALVGWEAYHAYMLNHTYYYYTMLKNGDHRLQIIGFALLALRIVWVLFWTNKPTVKNIGRSWIVCMIIWSLLHVFIKGGLVGTSGLTIFLLNISILLGVIILFVGGLYAGGARLYTHFLKRKLESWSDILLSLGLGIGTFLIINYILVFIQLFYRPFAWLQFALMAGLIWKQKPVWSATYSLIYESIHTLRWLPTGIKISTIILIILTIMYMIYGFNLSFIPYSTAWDANHAYMYFPKIWALNHGLFFEWGPTTTPHIWMVYIAYFFSLFQVFGSNFILAPDTVAVVLNNISGRFALLFGLGATHAIISYFKDFNFFRQAWQEIHVILIAWMFFLLWLMSGMGAFLVFVDNKTDLGVMSLTLLALLSGFLFLRTLRYRNLEHFSWSLHDNIPALLSAFFFAVAVLAKPTALQDVVIFGIFFVGTSIGIFGAIGLFLLILAILGKAEAMSMIFYISKRFALPVGIAGLLGVTIQLLRSSHDRLLQLFKPLMYRAIAILALICTLKGSYFIVQYAIDGSLTGTKVFKATLLSQRHKPWTTLALVADTENNQFDADHSAQIPKLQPQYCSLSQAGLTKETLYDNLGEIEGGGLIEDFWRYIWFGQRTFSHPNTRSAPEKKYYGSVKIGYTLAKLFFPYQWCYSLNKTADQLCEQPQLKESLSGIQSLLTQSAPDSNQYKFLSGIIAKYEQVAKEDDDNRKQALLKEITQNIDNYVGGNVIEVTIDNHGYSQIAIPYAFLTPLNVIFNWSLQNHSSYYTDIGFIWILCLILLLAGTVSSLIHKHRELLILHIVTICGWILWWFLASGIIWYAVGIIAWTTFCNALFISKLLAQAKTNRIAHVGWYIVLSIIIIATFLQTILNLARISSQGSTGPFVWYKGHTGKSTQFLFNQQGFIQQEIIDHHYTQHDVFNLQFAHYNPFINHVKNRKNEDGVLIAGTYLQYFLHNQHNIISDGLLTEFWKRWSDGDPCKLTLRLQDKNIKYLVIDPNIWSVVMGDGNATLFDRFFAKIDKKNNQILEDGTMTMLIHMVQHNYLKLLYTNNIGAKYAYTLSDEELKQAILKFPHEDTKQQLLTLFASDSTLLRAKLAIPRFFPQEANMYIALIGDIFQARMLTNKWLEDLASILGKEIDSTKLTKAYKLLESKSVNNLQQLNKELTDDERTVLGYYLTIITRIQHNDTQTAQSIIAQLLQTSITWGSQLMTFELLK